MPIQIKICGITTPETLDCVINNGATHVGFNFVRQSPRFIEPARAAGLRERLPSHIIPVALVVNEDRDRIDSLRAQTGIETIQLHGDETPEFAAALGGDVWKALPVKTRDDLTHAARYRGAVSHILYDAKPPAASDLPGGTGQSFDWSVLEGFIHPLPWILAGGLNPDNALHAIERTGATFLDVASGVESAPGVKSVDKIRAFCQAVREHDTRQRSP